MRPRNWRTKDKIAEPLYEKRAQNRAIATCQRSLDRSSRAVADQSRRAPKLAISR